MPSPRSKARLGAADAQLRELDAALASLRGAVDQYAAGRRLRPPADAVVSAPSTFIGRVAARLRAIAARALMRLRP
jgi:hypothetical protein